MNSAKPTVWDIYFTDFRETGNSITTMHEPKISHDGRVLTLDHAFWKRKYHRQVVLMNPQSLMIRSFSLHEGYLWVQEELAGRGIKVG